MLQYLNGYICSARDYQYYITDKVDNWVKSVDVFYQISEKDPQADF